MTHLIDRDEVIKILNDSMRLHSTPMWEMINSFFEKRISKLQTHEDMVKQLIEKKCKEYFELYVQNNINEEQEIRWLQLQELLNELYPNN